jgi:hypothetical protein
MEYFDPSTASEKSYVEQLATDYSRSDRNQYGPFLDFPDDASVGLAMGGGSVWLDRFRSFGRKLLPKSVEEAFVGLSHDSLLDNVSGRWRKPIAFFWKVVSLCLIPLFYAGAAYCFFRFYMEWWEFVARILFLFTLFLVLYQSTVRISARPPFLEVLRFFLQEAAVVWVMWIVSSLIYTYFHHRLGIFSIVSSLAGLLGAGFTYFVSASRIRRKTGADKSLSYVFQVAKIVVANVIGMIAGYLLTPILWERASAPYDNYVIGMLFALVTFWIAVSLFCVESASNWSNSRLERGTDIRIN